MPQDPQNVSILYIGGPADKQMHTCVNESYNRGGLGLAEYSGVRGVTYEAFSFGPNPGQKLAYIASGVTPISIWKDIVDAYTGRSWSDSYMFVGGVADKDYKELESPWPYMFMRRPREIPSFNLSDMNVPVTPNSVEDTIEYTQKQFRIGNEYFLYYQLKDMPVIQVLDKLLLAYRGEDATLNDSTPHASCIHSCQAT